MIDFPNKENLSDTIPSIRCSKKLRAKIKKVAKLSNTRMANVARVLIEKGCDEYLKQKGEND